MKTKMTKHSSRSLQLKRCKKPSIFVSEEKNVTLFLKRRKYVSMKAVKKQQRTKQGTVANFKFINNTFKKCLF